MMGRKIELVMEDSVNPQTASAKAERLIERDKVAMIIGEISSASVLRSARSPTESRRCSSTPAAIRCASRRELQSVHVPHRGRELDVRDGGRQYLLRENLVKGKKWYSLTADYAFGHDLLRVAKKFMEANGGQFAADELVPTDAADFSPIS